jgi:hypothetical protein
MKKQTGIGFVETQGKELDNEKNGSSVVSVGEIPA